MTGRILTDMSVLHTNAVMYAIPIGASILPSNPGRLIKGINARTPKKVV
jgi:hypothetical protein